MPTGSFDFAPYPPQLALDAVPIGVFLYDAGSDDDSPYTLIPNIRCEQIQYKEGATVPTAQFSYILDELELYANDWPDQFEELFPLTVAPSDYVVTTGTELVVLALYPDDNAELDPSLNPVSNGTTQILFHGYARVPQTDVSPATQAVTFSAVGIAVRCWDMPIGGRVQRNGSDPNANSGAASDIATDLPTRFNPSGTGQRAVGGILRNCTPDGYDVGEAYEPETGSQGPYPVFLDPAIDRPNEDGTPIQTFWGLSKAVRYILGTQNTILNADGDLLVDNPDFGVLDALLQDRRPVDGAQFFDPTCPETYTDSPNVLRDYDATNKAWPEVVAELLGFYGFGMRFVCEDDGDGNPYDYIEVYRKDAAGPTDPQPVYLPPAGTAITDEPTNLAAFHAGFDYHGVANDIFVESHLERYEISVILAPGFVPTSGDGEAANRGQFLKSFLDSTDADADQRKAYRYYVVDECEDGYYDVGTDGGWVASNPFDWSALLYDEESGEADYVQRYRPGKGTLFSKDPNNKPYKTQLAVATMAMVDANYPPQFFNPADFESTLDSQVWQEIDPSTWNLLPDRLGIMVTVENPEQWKIGPPKAGNDPVSGNPWPCPSGVLAESPVRRIPRRATTRRQPGRSSSGLPP